MLTLNGNSAAVMLVAKGGLRDLNVPSLERLQCAIAVMAGLTNPLWVKLGDVLRIVADVHDQVSSLGLLKNSARAMADSVCQSVILSDRARLAEMPCPGTALMNAMLSNLTCMRIGTEDGERLIDWTSKLPIGFEADVRLLSLKTWGAA